MSLSRVRLASRAVMWVLNRESDTGRPPAIPVEKKTRIALSVLAGEVSIAEVADLT